jgi:predicted transcriptional regulator
MNDDTLPPLTDEQIEGIKKAIKSLEAGKGIPHERVKAWAESLGTDH